MRKRGSFTFKNREYLTAWQAKNNRRRRMKNKVAKASRKRNRVK